MLGGPESATLDHLSVIKNNDIQMKTVRTSTNKHAVHGKSHDTSNLKVQVSKLIGNAFEWQV